MKGEVDILANFPIDTSQKKKAHSAMEDKQILVFPVDTDMHFVSIDHT